MDIELDRCPGRNRWQKSSNLNCYYVMTYCLLDIVGFFFFLVFLSTAAIKFWKKKKTPQGTVSPEWTTLHGSESRDSSNENVSPHNKSPHGNIPVPLLLLSKPSDSASLLLMLKNVWMRGENGTCLILLLSAACAVACQQIIDYTEQQTWSALAAFCVTLLVHNPRAKMPKAGDVPCGVKCKPWSLADLLMLRRLGLPVVSKAKFGF